MTLLNFKRNPEKKHESTRELQDFLKNYSIEVMPRTAEKITCFQDIFPKGTRVYIAHLEGTSIGDMIKTARKLSQENYPVMPHFPARMIKNKTTLREWILMYQGEAGVDQALLLAGGIAKPVGEFESSMQLLETGLFDTHSFKTLHFAGHPEGNKDIDPDGSNRNVESALSWKQKFSERTDANMALTTQFAFEAEPIIDWANGLKVAGIDIPIHIGIAGPAKLNTLIKFAVACGVGPSLKVLKKRAMDVKKLLLPYEPTDVLTPLARYKAKNPNFNIDQVHFFPLGGIKANANWVTENGGRAGIPAKQSWG